MVGFGLRPASDAETVHNAPSVSEQISRCESIYGEIDCVQFFARHHKTDELVVTGEFKKEIMDILQTRRGFLHASLRSALMPHNCESIMAQYKLSAEMGLEGMVIHLPTYKEVSAADFSGGFQNDSCCQHDDIKFTGGAAKRIISNEEKEILMNKTFKKLFTEIASLDLDNYPAILIEHPSTARYAGAVSMKKQAMRLINLAAKYSKNIRIGVCLDTCHIYIQGISLSSREDCEAYFGVFVNVDFPVLIHLNDSKTLFGDKIDEHGTLGLNIWRDDDSGLEYILGLHYPMIMELGFADLISSYNYLAKLAH